ncbi:alpha/beta fold hydrolase [Streptomyces triticagri]|uniref:alpha/beta fold hydrolase n=1 Tax=Streptomyces triticagri TaxID=2293568 RepID=UPI000FFBE628|nr:alpha/beta hydrolase [Streptomyces triticagri]
MPHDRTSPPAGAGLDPGRGLTERLVTLPDGRTLRTVAAGEGPGPLVLFEAGMSAPAACWVHTQREIGAHTRTLSYDRAGYGGSDVDPRPRTLDRLVDDLTALLDVLDERAPVVLVGHSWGGPVIRLFAERHPARVAGIVFVDSTVAETMPAKNAWLVAGSFRVMGFLARFGGAGLIERLTLPHGTSPDIDRADVAIMLRDYACVRAMRAGAREAEHIVSARPLVRRLQQAGTPDVPTICVQGGRVDRGTARTRLLLNDTAERLMHDTRGGRTVVVPEAGHLVPQERPGPVRDAVIEVLRSARTRPGAAGPASQETAD